MEAVVLLDGYLEYARGGVPLMRVAKRVSEDLRQMAVNQGEAISGVFRNEKGINNQLRSMESAFVGHTVKGMIDLLTEVTIQLIMFPHVVTE